VFRSRHDHFPALLERDAFLCAERFHGDPSFSAIPGLERTGSVVDAGVNDAGIVAGLVPTNFRLLLDHRHPQAGEPHRENVRGGRAYDASAHDGNFCMVHGAMIIRSDPRRYEVVTSRGLSADSYSFTIVINLSAATRTGGVRVASNPVRQAESSQ